VLHHKQPALFPLLDTKTARVLSTRPGARTAWQQIHSEITSAQGAYDALRCWFEQEAEARSGVALSLPRIHDILLWLHVVDQWDDAIKAGRTVLSK
jgi:Family of unknown function (DUF6308)